MKEIGENVKNWVVECLGEDVLYDTMERNRRFLEEALELVQACGCSRETAHSLVDYVFDRPVGEIPQEMGGALSTLFALSIAQKQDLIDATQRELERAWLNIDKIRTKQAAKPKF